MQRKLLLWIGVLVALGAGGAGYYYMTRPAPAPASVPVAPPPLAATPPPAAATAPANPVASTPGSPLPALDESDAAVLGALEELGGRALAVLLRPQDLVRHVVASVDALPRARLETEVRPLRRPAGEFLALGPDDGATIDPHNAERYAPYVRVVEALDMHRLAALYRRYYPLFQQAFQDLGNPDGYFNDRLVEVIDHLLATPGLNGPVRLVRPKVMFEFADPKLQALSVGQKALLRLAPAQRRSVLAQLRTLRAAVATTAATQ
ncbi:MAG: DUF3014 domain-containing protein [Gammaproteobacteria bacterium]|nr:DUF3014 domain-containing protein [Gammaproteobacteria bacterium]